MVRLPRRWKWPRRSATSGCWGRYSPTRPHTTGISCRCRRPSIPACWRRSCSGRPATLGMWPTCCGTRTWPCRPSAALMRRQRWATNWGRWQEALESFAEAARLEPPGFWAGGNQGPLFLARAYMGDSASALAMLDESRGNLPRPGQANGWGAWVMLVAVVEGLAVLGERDEAARLYPLTLEAIATDVLVPWVGMRSFEAVAGIAAACGGRWEKAEEHYREALRQAHELPHKIEQPEVRRWYARMLLDRDAPGDRAKARELLTEAIAMYRRIGMPKHVEMAERMLREV